jgi:RNase P subunit RPR2
MASKITELAQALTGLAERYQFLAERYRGLAERLKDVENEVELHRGHLGLRKQIMCPKCRAPLHPAAKACARCGASWDADEAAAEKRGMPR